MSDDHLPECERWFTDMPEPDECPACEMFRACEQRVLSLNPVAAGVLIAQRSRERTLDAALEAVDKLRQSNYTGWEPWMLAGVCVDKALAAIDALRETT